MPDKNELQKTGAAILKARIPALGPEITIEEHLVGCRKIKPRSFITVENCKKCEFHAGHEEVAEEDPDKGRPVEFDVICNLPVRIRTEHFVSIKERE